MTAKMCRCDDGVPGRIRFNFRLGEELSEDVTFEVKAMETVNPSLVGHSLLPPNSKAYDIRTNDCGYSAEALWQQPAPHTGTLTLKVGGSAAKQYHGSSLDQCVEQAYDNGAFG